MKILSVDKVREADAFTIKYEPVSSVDLMERAANACVVWIDEHILNINKMFIVLWLGK